MNGRPVRPVLNEIPPPGPLALAGRTNGPMGRRHAPVTSLTMLVIHFQPAA